MAETISDNAIPEDEFYDGPIVQFPGSLPGSTAGAMAVALNVPQPGFDPPPQQVSKAKYVEMINAALGILGARLLGLIAVIGAVVMFGLAVWDPMPWRTYTVAAYAAVVLWPIVWLYLRRG